METTFDELWAKMLVFLSKTFFIIYTYFLLYSLIYSFKIKIFTNTTVAYSIQYSILSRTCKKKKHSHLYVTDTIVSSLHFHPDVCLTLDEDVTIPNLQLYLLTHLKIIYTLK